MNTKTTIMWALGFHAVGSSSTLLFLADKPLIGITVSALIVLVLIFFYPLSHQKTAEKISSPIATPAPEPITPLRINAVLLDRKADHIVLELGVHPDAQSPAALKSRVMLNPHIAKLLLLGLTVTLEEHEQEHGAIKAPSLTEVRTRVKQTKMLNIFGSINLN